MALIERERPDLAFLDLQMPELDGLGVVRVLKRKVMPLIVFVTAYEEYALRAFELNAVDYLLKPANPARLGEALSRAHDRLERADLRASEVDRVKAAVDAYEAEARLPWLERIPVRQRDVVTLLPVKQIASIVAERELLHITTARNEKHTITYRLKDLETRLPPSKFVRLGRGPLAAIEMISERAHDARRRLPRHDDQWRGTAGESNSVPRRPRAAAQAVERVLPGAQSSAHDHPGAPRAHAVFPIAQRAPRAVSVILG